MIKWKVSKMGMEIEELKDPMTNADHSLVLTNVQKFDEGTYFATGSNSEGEDNGPQVKLEVVEIPGEAMYNC